MCLTLISHKSHFVYLFVQLFLLFYILLFEQVFFHLFVIEINALLNKLFIYISFEKFVSNLSYLTVAYLCVFIPTGLEVPRDAE